MFMEQWIQSLRRRIQILQDRSLLRQLRHDSVHLDFSSNDYLALNQNGVIAEMLRDLVQSDDKIRSIGSTGSRLIRGHYEIFERVEAEFAAFTGTEAATLFHSGYAANTGVIPTVVDRRDIIFCDRLCHASLLDGIRLSGARRYYFEHNNLNDLEAKLKRHGGSQRNWIITESIFSMDGDSPDLQRMTRLAAAHNAL
ncbi:MAG: aminotransferase class I/II-fold pyridoxal phosphate-dependent enzyme, partial [Leptospiraceae bacterium]|nr:aminotransferase class I/II-fold pyridoxal phosphate-dependent enzyme [Leptospiraceae bacterium]